MTPYLIFAIFLTVAATSYFSALNLAMVQASRSGLENELEARGIGRPSTYASILTTLRDREYVRMDKNRFIPEDNGRLVTAFLEQFFTQWVEYDFTAGLEEQLAQMLFQPSQLHRIWSSGRELRA